uniref:Uncharacterized protein n=1 Tax=Anguilla anguilla TaxID=7936 RepID=A0A0E9VT58_ANGAN
MTLEDSGRLIHDNGNRKLVLMLLTFGLGYSNGKVKQ